MSAGPHLDHGRRARNWSKPTMTAATFIFAIVVLGWTNANIRTQH
jgi:hypothetical protein